jgi:hypothetical protein
MLAESRTVRILPFPISQPRLILVDLECTPEKGESFRTWWERKLMRSQLFPNCKPDEAECQEEDDNGESVQGRVQMTHLGII